MSNEPSETVQRPRRSVLQTIGALLGAGLASGSAAATDATPADVAARAGVQEDAYTTTDVEVESFDGTTIAATLWEPTTPGPHPAVLATHGWGQDRSGRLTELAPRYAANDYVVLTYDSRGFGESGGVVKLTSEAERRDAQALISYLAAQDSVLTDGEDDPRLGLDGTSYGGGIQPRLAIEDDRVDAIVPRYTWFDLAESLDPNGVLKTGWARALLFVAQRDRLDDEFVALSEAALDRGFTTEEDRAFFDARSTPNYEGDLEASTLVIGNWYDRLFPPLQSEQSFRFAGDSDVETALIYNNSDVHTTLAGSPPGEGRSQEFANEAALEWFDRHLKDEDDGDIPSFRYYQEATDEFVEESSYPPLRDPRGAITHSLSEAVTLTGSDADPATFDYDVEERAELAGTPVLEVAVQPTGTGRSHMMVAVQRVSDGEVTTINRQVTPFFIEEAGTRELTLSGIEQVFEPGDTLRIAIATSSEALNDSGSPIGLYAPTEEGAGIELQPTTELTLAVPPFTPTDGSYYADRFGPGMDAPAALAALAGLGYLGWKRLADDED